MSTASEHAQTQDLHAHGHPSHLAHHFDTPAQQFTTGKLGMWTFLATEVLMFGGLFCAYAVYRYNHPQVYLWAHNALDPFWGMVNTIVLLASSFTMAWGVRAAQLNQKGLLQWMLILTFLGGVVFMCVKAVEYQNKWKYFLFPGEFNSLNAEFKPPEGKSIDEIRAITIGHVEEHAKAHSSGEHETAPAHQAAPSHQAAAAPETPPTATLPQAHGSTASEAKPDAPKHDSPAPAIQEAYTASVALTHVQSLVTAPDMGNESAAISAPTLSTAGTNPDVDKHVGHHMTSYAELEPLDKNQLQTFFSIYFMMTGLHGIHVLVGMGLIAWLFLRASANQFSNQYFAPVDLVGLYWHLVDLIWIFLFPLLYLIH